MQFSIIRRLASDTMQEEFTFEGSITEHEVEAAVRNIPEVRARFERAKTPSELLLALAEVFLHEERQIPRQIGFTSQQMLQAPIGATFVWCNGALLYPQNLARSLGRADLQVVSPEWFRDVACGYQGRAVLDHACETWKRTEAQTYTLNSLRSRGVV